MKRLLMVFTLAVGLMTCAGGLAALAATPSADPGFDTRQAMMLLNLQLSYGPRPAGSPALRRLALGLRGRLPRGHFEPFGKRLRNIVGLVPGRDTHHFLVVGAHYDTKDLPGYLGANNGAAGTAVAIELARALRPRMLEPSVVFILFDGEEAPGGVSRTPQEFLAAGLRGSKFAARRYGRAQAMILVDFIGQRGLQFPREANSDPSLWSRLRLAAQEAGTQSTFPNAATSYGVEDDHLPFRWRHVPTIDLSDMAYPCWFKRCDTRERISPQSLGITGETVLRLLSDLGR